jgi:hypothetical protein
MTEKSDDDEKPEKKKPKPKSTKRISTEEEARRWAESPGLKPPKEG